MENKRRRKEMAEEKETQEAERTNSMSAIERYLLTVKNITQAGNFSIRFDTQDAGELSELGSDLNKMLDRFESIFGNISDLTKQISKVSLHTMSSIAEQDAVANQQSASVAEITSTMEELSATSRQIAMNADSVLSIAEEGVDNAQGGVKSIEELENRMEIIADVNNRNSNEIIELGRKSGEISKVMEIIKGIADQTRMIAFNAALEAASAGESGKRFGIVAVEIRRLADNVTESAKEIAGNISEIQTTVKQLVVSSEKSQSEINNGVEEVSETKAVLNSILDSAHANQVASKQISTSTQQQNTASNQVVIAIKEISLGAQSNAKSIQETGSRIENLANMATDLEKKMEEFEMGEGKIEWTPIYNLGYPVLDAQHKALIQEIRSFYEALEKGGDFGGALEKLRIKAKEHFDYEESLFEKYAYDDREKHEEKHKSLGLFLDDIQSGKIKDKKNIYKHLKTWLNRHILVQDRMYVESFKKKKIESL